MKTAKRFFLIFFILLSVKPLHPQLTQSQKGLFSPSESLIFRNLQPGEVIQVTIPSSDSYRRIILRFSGMEFPLVLNKKGDRFQGYLGIDLELQPGLYELEIVFYQNDEGVNIHRHNLDIQPRNFSFARLQLPHRYVIPPKDVLPRIEAEKKMLQSIFLVFTQEKLAAGRFIIPLAGKRAGNFGQKRLMNDFLRTVHSGEDIQAELGEQVKASNSGRVVLSSNLYYAGNTIIIDHGLGVFSLYCHLSEIHVNQGHYVRKGQIIGNVGATGRVTGPHLHWSIKVHGQRVDPDSLLFFSFD